MHKTMIAPVCLGILLVGIIMTPSAFAIFPDPEEDPRNYLVRYYTEPSYQAWFDKNYPNDTIEDKVGYPKKIVTDDYYVSPFGFTIEPPKGWDIEVSPSAIADDEGNIEAGIVVFAHPRADDCNSYPSNVIVWYNDEKKANDWEGQGITSWSDLDLLWYFEDTMIFDEQSNLKITDQSVTEVSNDEYIVRYYFTDSNILPADEECPNRLNVTLKNSMIYFLEPGGEFFEFIYSAEPQDYDTDISEINKMLKTFHTGKTQKLSDLLEDYAPELKSAAAEPSGGCGPGTVLKGNTCVLAPQESSEGCGAGTVMVNGVCQLDKSSGGSIPPLYIAGGAAAIGAAIVGIIFVVKRGSSGTSAPKPARQDLDDYEDQYLRRQGQRPSPKPAETRQTSSSCNSCGRPLKPTAKFCGKCGSRQ